MLELRLVCTEACLDDYIDELYSVAIWDEPVGTDYIHVGRD